MNDCFQKRERILFFGLFYDHSTNVFSSVVKIDDGSPIQNLILLVSKGQLFNPFIFGKLSFEFHVKSK